MPYNPQLNPYGPQLIAQGYAGAAQSIGGGLEKFLARQQQQQQQDQMANGALQQMSVAGLLAPGQAEYLAQQPTGVKLGVLDTIMRSAQVNQTRASTALTGAQTSKTTMDTAEAQRRMSEAGNYGVVTDQSLPGVAIVSDKANNRIMPINTATSREQTSEPPAWAQDAMKAQPDLYWNGSRLAARSSNPLAALGGLLGMGGAPAAQAPAGAAPSAPATQQIPEPKTKAERDQLPAGTSYKAPDGKIYIKK